MSIGCFADEYYWVYLFLGSFGCTLKSAKAENMNTEFNTTMPRCHDCQYIARLCNMRLPFLALNLSFVPYFKPDKSRLGTAVASMRRTEALASVKFYQILSIFIFFIRLIILEDFIRLISYNGPCVRLGCSFFLATALLGTNKKLIWNTVSLQFAFCAGTEQPVSKGIKASHTQKAFILALLSLT